jgi:acyl-CoA reductase-like NAD-dependent aldehyde dehydrogenase
MIEAARGIKVGPTDIDEQPHMGPVITRQHRDRVSELIELGTSEGATLPADGRGVKISAARMASFSARPSSIMCKRGCRSHRRRSSALC